MRSSQLLTLAALLSFALASIAADHPLLGRSAPDFALRAGNGINVRLSEHRGDVVLLTFWSSRCNQCRAQLAVLDPLHATYKSAGLVTLAVSIDDNPVRAREYLQSVRSQFPMLLDPAKQVGRSYDVNVLPMVLLIDRAGAVRYVHRDYKSGAEAEYVRELKTLLDE
ncbi:MAG: TlpA disulfide reductase family protein [Steroidobacteraceae bacterium]